MALNSQPFCAAVPLRNYSLTLSLTLSLPLATVVDTVTVPLATKVDRTPSVPLAMIVAVLYETLGKQPVFKFLPPETRHWEPENRQRKS